MTGADIDAVVSIETSTSPSSWTRGIFEDCLRLNYYAKVLTVNDETRGFIIALIAAGECHLLNVAVAVSHQRQGWGRQLVEYLIRDMQAKAISKIYLEVRTSNNAAIALYHHLQFTDDGARKDYYRSEQGREDALLMSLDLI